MSGRSFGEFVTARSPELLRTAYLLSGGRAAAVDLLQEALMAVHRHWAELADDEAATLRARRELLAGQTSWRRRLWLGDLLSSIPALASVRGLPGFALPDPDTGPRDATTTALATLPPGLRAALVLRFGADLPEAATAQVLDCPVEQVRDRTDAGLTRLRGLLAAGGEPDDDVVRRLRADLAARAGEAPAPPDRLEEQVVDACRAQRRHRAGLVALAGVLVLVVVLVALTV